jgi:lambda family phage portal protein
MNSFDKLVGYFMPKVGMKRMAWRQAYEHARAFDAASKSRRTENWRATGADANKENEWALSTLRNRSRDQVRNNVYAKRTIQTISNNVVGKGIRPTPDDVSRAAEKRIMKTWKEWAEKKRCDFEGLLNFYGIQKLVMKTVAMSGECLVIRRRENDVEFPLSLQVLEPDFIDTNKTNVNAENGNRIMYGIEFNSLGKKVAYWLFESHPGSDRMMSLTSRRVPIEDVAHIFAVERPGQVRGIPWMHASMIRMKDFDDYEDAELVRQKIAACFTVFVQDLNPDLNESREEKDLASRVEPGIIERLGPNQTVSFANPPTTQGYESYSRKILQGISAGVGITYEQMTGDYSNVNFSSGRMGWIEIQRNVEDWQDHMVIPMLCDTVWEWFIEAMNIAGKVRGSVMASWTPPRREMIDPVKETNALSLQVRNGFISFREAVRQLGYDPDDTIDEIDAHNKILDEKKIILDSDPRVGKAPIGMGADNTDENEDGSEDGQNAGNNSNGQAKAPSRSGKQTTSQNTDGSESEILKVKSIKELVDAYGAGVRSGAITPTLEDEKLIRQLAELPSVTKEVEESWKKDGGIRRPITLKIESETPPQNSGQE